VTLLPAATVPLMMFEEKPVGPVPPLHENDVKVNVVVPVLPIVNVRSTVDPIVTFPNARSPETVMIFVAAVVTAAGAVVDEDDPHAAATATRVAMTAPRTKRLLEVINGILILRGKADSGADLTVRQHVLLGSLVWLHPWLSPRPTHRALVCEHRTTLCHQTIHATRVNYIIRNS
jgi:hypothetical protein